MFWRTALLLLSSLALLTTSLIVDRVYDIGGIYDDGDDDLLKEAVPWHHQHRYLSDNTSAPTITPAPSTSPQPSTTPLPAPTSLPTSAPSRLTASKSSESGISSWEIGVGVAILLASTICILLSILAIKISLDFYARHPREFHVDLDEETGTNINGSTTDKATLLPPKAPRDEKSGHEKSTFGIAMMDKNSRREVEYQTPPPPGGFGRNSTGSFDFVQYDKYQKGHRKQPTI